MRIQICGGSKYDEIVWFVWMWRQSGHIRGLYQSAESKQTMKILWILLTIRHFPLTWQIPYWIPKARLARKVWSWLLDKSSDHFLFPKKSFVSFLWVNTKNWHSGTRFVRWLLHNWVLGPVAQSLDSETCEKKVFIFFSRQKNFVIFEAIFYFSDCTVQIVYFSLIKDFMNVQKNLLSSR